MYREIYFRDISDPKYNPRILESDNKLENLISKIKMILYTRKGEVLGEPDLGMNLDDYLFETNYNEMQIKNLFFAQIEKFIPELNEYKIDCEVGIRREEYHHMIVLSISIDNIKILEIEI